MTYSGAKCLREASRAERAAELQMLGQAVILTLLGGAVARYVGSRSLSMSELLSGVEMDQLFTMLGTQGMAGLTGVMALGSGAMQSRDRALDCRSRVLEDVRTKWTKIAQDKDLREALDAHDDFSRELEEKLEAALRSQFCLFDVDPLDVDDVVREIADAVSSGGAMAVEESDDIPEDHSPGTMATTATVLAGTGAVLGVVGGLAYAAQSSGVGDENLWDDGAAAGELDETDGEEYGADEPAPADSSTKTKSPLQLYAERQSENGGE
jgi:hypothetical protein